MCSFSRARKTTRPEHASGYSRAIPKLDLFQSQALPCSVVSADVGVVKTVLCKLEPGETTEAGDVRNLRRSTECGC